MKFGKVAVETDESLTGKILSRSMNSRRAFLVCKRKRSNRKYGSAAKVCPLTQ